MRSLLAGLHVSTHGIITCTLTIKRILRRLHFTNVILQEQECPGRPATILILLPYRFFLLNMICMRNSLTFPEGPFKLITSSHVGIKKKLRRKMPPLPIFPNLSKEMYPFIPTKQSPNAGFFHFTPNTEFKIN